jgi:hypothetical protein
LIVANGFIILPAKQCHVGAFGWRFQSRVPVVVRQQPPRLATGKMFKPFKPPALLRKVEKPVSVDLTASDSESEIQHRPYKKRRLLVHTVEEPVKKTLPPASQAVNAPRKPLLVVKNTVDNKEAASSALAEGPEGYYMVLWYV